MLTMHDSASFLALVTANNSTGAYFRDFSAQFLNVDSGTAESCPDDVLWYGP